MENNNAVMQDRIMARETAIELSFDDLALVPGAGSCAGDTNGNACDIDKCDSAL
jgi:hypothetical protein